MKIKTTNPESSRRWVDLAIWSAVLLLAFSRFVNLGYGDLKDWDECLYAWRAKIVCLRGAWLDQSDLAWDGFYSAAFPPLQIWTTAILFKIFGFSEFVARAWPALTGAGCVIVLFLMGRRLGRSKWTGLFAAIFLTSVWYFTVYSRRAQFDVPYTFWIVLSMYGYVGYLDHVRIVGRRQIEIESRAGWWLALAGVALGLGLMNKIALALMAPFFMGVLSLYSWMRGRHPFRRIVVEQLIVNGIGLAIVLPWHLAMSLGPKSQDFWNYYVGYHLLGRSTRVLDLHSGEWYFYFVEIARQLSEPLKALTLVALPMFAYFILVSFRAGTRGDNPVESSPDGTALDRPWDFADFRCLLPLVWLAAPLAIFSLSATKRDTYTIPLYPPIALMGALLLGELLRDRRRIVWLTVSLALMMLFCILSRMKSFGRNMDLLLDDLSKIALFGDVMGQLAMLVFGIPVGIGVLYWVLRRRPGAYGVAASAILVALAVSFSLRPALGVFKPDRATRSFGWQELRPYLDKMDYDCLVMIGEYTDPGLFYYLNGLHLGWNPEITYIETKNNDPELLKKVRQHKKTLVVVMKWVLFEEWSEEDRAMWLDQMKLLAEGYFTAIYEITKPGDQQQGNRANVSKAREDNRS